MKGLMVSLIIVIFAGVASSVSAVGQQAGDAAGFRSRLGLQPLRALERPGPDDSEDGVDSRVRPPLLSRDSTTTSNSFGGQQFGSPAPASAADQNVRFDVKVDDDAIKKLRQGQKVFSSVDVRDQATNQVLHPGVVSDIALFRGANAGKGMQGFRFEPAPMEPGSSTLKFEIHQDQLDRIESDAFLFSVPEQLRGKFDRVEFVAVAGPAGSHEFSDSVSGGTRGTGFGLSGSEDSRFGAGQAGPADRFVGTNASSKFAQQWGGGGLPQPGPSFEPGDNQFTGPYIEPRELEARRNQVAPLDRGRNLARRNDFSPQQNVERPALNTGGRFQVADREPALPVNRSPFGRVWEGDQNTNDRNGFDQDRSGRDLIDQRDAVNQRTAIDQRNDRSGQSLDDQRLVALQQALAAEKAQRELLARDASDWKREASRLAQERNDYSDQLRLASNRQVVQPPVGARSADYRSTMDSNYWSRALNMAGEVVRPFGANRGDFQSRDAGFETSRLTDSDILLQRENARLAQQVKDQAVENGRLEGRLASVQQGIPERGGAYRNGIQQTSGYAASGFNGVQRGGYVESADLRNINGPNYRVPEEPVVGQPRQRVAGLERNVDPRDSEARSADRQQESATVKSRSSNLIWLLPLLLGSLALNFFLWLHCRTLDMRYGDLADELRDTVGASTV